MRKFLVFVLLATLSISIAKEAVLGNQAYDPSLNSSDDIGFWTQSFSGFTVESRGIKFMDMLDENVIWTAAYDGSTGGPNIQEVSKSVDGGENWSTYQITACTGGDMAMIKGIDETRAYAVIHSSDVQGIYVTMDGGGAWNRQESADFNLSGSFPNVVHFFNETDGFAQGDPVGGFYELYTTSDAGQTWTRVPTENIPAPLSGEWGVIGYYDAYGDNIWWGTQKGRVFRSTDKGYTWEAAETGLATFVDVAFRDELNGLAIDKGSNSIGQLFETSDGGITWSEIFTVGLNFTNDFEFIPGTNTVVSTGAASGFSGASFSFDGGHNWEQWTAQSDVQMLATDWVSPTAGFAGGFSGIDLGMFKYNGDLVTGIDNNFESGITNYQLNQNYPNPFNPTTSISFALRNSANVQLSVYDAKGAVVANLVNGFILEGSHSVEFNAADLTTGVYYYTISVNDIATTKKMMLLK